MTIKLEKSSQLLPYTKTQKEEKENVRISIILLYKYLHQTH